MCEIKRSNIHSFHEEIYRKIINELKILIQSKGLNFKNGNSITTIYH